LISAASARALTRPRAVATEAFDGIDLEKTWRAAKATKVPAREAIATLICLKLEETLGPSVAPKPPVRTKAEVMRDHLALGVALLKLKQDEHERFGAIAYEQFKVSPKSTAGYRTMAAARLYADRPEITSKISWGALCALSAPSLPAVVRRKFEAVIMSGQKVMAPHIWRGLQAHAKRSQPDQPATWMAA
jgi:hypothetical protein